MPTYEYVCNNCGHEFELFQSMTDRVKRKCPECGKRSLERLIGTGAGIIFKGSGFYETDYRSESYRKAAEAEKKTASPEKANGTAKSESSSTGKSDSGAAKSESKSDTGSGKKAKATPKPASSTGKSRQ